MSGGGDWRRDEYARLRFAERGALTLIVRWRADANDIRDHSSGCGRPMTADEEARVAELEGCALDLEQLLDGTHAPGGPAADHLAEARWHLEQLCGQHRAGRATRAGRAETVR